MYLSDKQRIEISLPVQMILAAIISGVSDQTTPEFLETKNNLMLAGNDPVSDLPDKKAIKILNRTRDLLYAITKEHISEGSEVSKVALITFHFMSFIIENGYLKYEEGCAFDKSINSFMGALQKVAEEPKVNASAIKQAKKMLKKLQGLGYYENVQISD